AAIATEQGQVAAAPASGASGEGAAEAGARLGYRLGVRDGRLTLARVIVRGGSEAPLRGSLASDAVRIRERDLTPTHDDLRIDRVVAATSRDVVPLERLADVLDSLSSAEDVTLEGRPV